MTASRHRPSDRSLRTPLVVAALLLAAGLGLFGVTRLTDDGGSTVQAMGCELVPATFNGQGEGRRLGSSEFCNRIDVALQAVTDPIGLTSIDWSNDIKVCEKHPSAATVEVAVITAAGRELVTDSFFRGNVPPGAQPITSIDIIVPDAYAPAAEIQPIAVCRTSSAEMIMTFRSGS